MVALFRAMRVVLSEWGRVRALSGRRFLCHFLFSLFFVLRPADKSHSFLSFFLSFFRTDTKTARSVDTSPPVTVELGNIASTQLVAVWRVVSTTTES